MNYGNIGNFLGFLAAIAYFATLLPSIIRVVISKFYSTKFCRFLLKYRRRIGVIAWIIAFMHGTFIVIERQLNLFDFGTAKNFLQGLGLITIFTLLAVTSNDYSVRHLKQNWKKIHRLTYLGLLILPWHIIDKMWTKWTIWTPISLIIVTILAVLSIIRINIYYQKQYNRS